MLGLMTDTENKHKRTFNDEETEKLQDNMSEVLDRAVKDLVKTSGVPMTQLDALTWLEMGINVERDGLDLSEEVTLVRP